METTIGLPSLTIAFQKAAQATANRSKKGYVGVFVRDTQAQGVHILTSPALIPSELGADNKAYLQRAFTGSDRGEPSRVTAVVIATGTEDTTALEAGLKLIENQTLDYIAPPPDVTENEKAVLEAWVKARREAYFTEKLVEPNPAEAPDDMGIIAYGKVQSLRQSMAEDVSVHILLQGCVDPDLKDPGLRERFGGATPAETVKAFLLPGEIEDLSRAIERLCGYRRTTIEEVKNG